MVRVTDRDNQGPAIVRASFGNVVRDERRHDFIADLLVGDIAEVDCVIHIIGSAKARYFQASLQRSAWARAWCFSLPLVLKQQRLELHTVLRCLV